MTDTSPPAVRHGFKEWLVAKNYSGSTVRNYLVDIDKYLSAAKNPNVFSESSLSGYIQSLSGNLNAPRTLASLSLFCQFAVDQNIISTNPLKKIQKVSSRSLQTSAFNLDSILNNFKTYLFKHHKTAHTVTNYIADIKQFINFCETHSEI